MKEFILPVSLQAYTEEEAKAKLDVLILLGSVVYDLKMEDLTVKTFQAIWSGVLGKLAHEKQPSGTKQG